MGSDGLLYNKIIKKRCVNYLSNKSVKEVLNEAKKKFPKIEDAHYRMEDAYIKLLEIHNWFDEQFGDSS